MIGFLRNFKLACDTNGMKEGAAILIFNFFIEKSESVALNARLASKHKAQSRKSTLGKNTTMTTYPQIVNNFLRISAKDKNIVDTED